jgi:gliding motility-associated protein GldM
MALPKEPRQKMINMMYLVLTALLALNVSAEIINAFKVVDNSLLESNSVLTSSTNNVYSTLSDMLKDPKTAEKAGIWQPKAMAAKTLADQTYSQLEKYKDMLKRESGYSPETGDSTYKVEQIDAATRLFDTKGEGKNLYAALENFKKGIMADPEIAKALGSKIPLSLELPKSAAGNTKTGDAIKDWTISYFHMTPTVAALTILSKFENDVKNTESQVATYCANQVGSVKLIMDKFEPLIGTNATYLMPGDQMEVTAGLGAYNSNARPVVTIDGRPVTTNANGVAETKFNVGGSGAHKMNVVVNYTDPNTGEKKTITKDVEYTVGMPSGVSVMADKMNVLYIGVENPLTITAGAGAEKVNASFTGGTIKKLSGNKYVAIPSSGAQGEQSVTVLVEGKAAGKVTYRVKQLPNPAAYVGNLKPGAVPSATFKAMGGVIAKLEDSEFDAPFEVVSYHLGAISADIPDFNDNVVTGPRWNGAAATLVSKLKPGALVAITQIQVKGPDGRVRTLNGSLSYNLK